MDSGGNLYATWDVQGANPDRPASDIGWLSYSTDFAIRRFPGEADTPTVIRRMSWDALEQRIRGELDWEQATAGGHVKIDGPGHSIGRVRSR